MILVNVVPLVYSTGIRSAHLPHQLTVSGAGVSEGLSATLALHPNEKHSNPL